ncbi:MAG: hypothetical protein WC758_00310 [Candidatus Woesearchaeota archaeon]|jgi:hypothetical protein
MALKEPDNMDELVYFTRRSTEDGTLRAWVFRETCPKCKKAMMGKPHNEKTGKIKIRDKEYVCPACNYIAPAEEYEDTLTINVDYTCGGCKKANQIAVPFKRKTYMGVKAVVFECQNCKRKIPITKKMKAIKEKKGKVAVPIPDLDDDE